MISRRVCLGKVAKELFNEDQEEFSFWDSLVDPKGESKEQQTQPQTTDQQKTESPQNPEPPKTTQQPVDGSANPKPGIVDGIKNDWGSLSDTTKGALLGAGGTLALVGAYHAAKKLKQKRAEMAADNQSYQYHSYY